MKTLITMLLFSLSLMAQNPKIVLPDEVAVAFEKEFPNAHSVIWNNSYRDGNDLRYEATFYMKPANYMVSYSTTGEVKVLEKSLAPNQLLQAAKDYVHTNYRSMNITEASEIVTDQKIKTYEVGLSENKKFLVAVFDDLGNFLFMRQVKN